jgi:preprotein translocase subunit SecD
MARALSRLFLFAVLLLPPINCAAQAPKDDPPPARFELRLAQETPGDGLVEATVVNTDKRVYLFKDALITNNDVIDARVVEEGGLFASGARASSYFDIHVMFTEEGAQKMARASETHIGKPIAILVDGKVVSAPIVRSVIRDRAAIAGSFSKEEAESLASRIRSK